MKQTRSTPYFLLLIVFKHLARKNLILSLEENIFQCPIFAGMLDKSKEAKSTFPRTCTIAQSLDLSLNCLSDTTKILMVMIKIKKIAKTADCMQELHKYSTQNRSA